MVRERAEGALRFPEQILVLELFLGRGRLGWVQHCRQCNKLREAFTEQSLSEVEVGLGKPNTK